MPKEDNNKRTMRSRVASGCTTTYLGHCLFSNSSEIFLKSTINMNLTKFRQRMKVLKRSQAFCARLPWQPKGRSDLPEMLTLSFLYLLNARNKISFRFAFRLEWYDSSNLMTPDGQETDCLPITFPGVFGSDELKIFTDDCSQSTPRYAQMLHSTQTFFFLSFFLLTYNIWHIIIFMYREKKTHLSEVESL